MRGSSMLSPVHSGLLLFSLVACVPQSRAQEKTVTPTAQTQADKNEAAKVKPLMVAGKIVGPDGAPLKARLAFRQYTSGVRRWEEDLSTIISTDDNGLFSTQIEQPLEMPDNLKLYLGTATVVAPGFMPATFALQDAADLKKPFELKLNKGIAVSGVVKDGAGAPLAGIKVQLSLMIEEQADERGIGNYVSIPKSLAAETTAITGADGRWTLDMVRPKARAVFILSDAKWAQQRIDVKTEAGATQVPDITARPGATLRGKITREDGTAAEKVRVTVSSQTGNGTSSNAVTAADGSFELSSLGAGSYRVSANDPSGDWVSEPLRSVLLKEGVEGEAPAIVMTRGALIEGQVTDAETGKPLAEVGIGTTQGYGSGTSDKTGRYSMRVVPGKIALYVMGKPQGYLYPEIASPSKQMMLTLEKGATKTIDFKLPRGVKLGGTLKIDGGDVAKVPDKLAIEFREVGSDSYWNAPRSVLKDGAWSIDGLNRATYKLVPADEEWEIVSPKTLTAPQTGPIEVLVRHVTLPPLIGKVVTRDGKPVEKVKINASISVPVSENRWTGRQSNIESGVDGTFQIPKIKADYRVTLSASRDGYKYLRGGTAEAKDGVWTVQQIVMLPLQSRVAGRVLDAAGKAVAGVRVLSPDGNPPKDDAKERVVTDAQGRFELTGLPEGEVTVIAANEQGAATMRAKSTLDAAANPDLDWKLRPHRVVTAPDVERAYTILEDVWETSRGSNWYRRDSVPSDLVAADFDLALDLARGGVDKKPIPENVLAQLITKLIETDPTRALDWAPAQLPNLKDAYRRYSATIALGMTAVKLKPELAAQLLAEAKTIAIEGDMQKIYGPAHLAAFEARLGHTEAANKLADVAIAAAQARGKTESAGVLGAVAEVLAKGSASLALRALKQIVVDPKKEYEQSSAYSRAISELAKHDVPGALQLLEMLGKLENQQADYAFGWSARALIKALGPTDAKAALTLARRVNENYRAEALLAAARFAPKNEMLPLLREAVAAVPEHPWNAGSTLASIARQTADIDVAAGKEMLDLVRSTIDTLKRSGGASNSWRVQQGASTIAAYAMLLSRSDPLQSRLMLEEEWAFTRSQGGDQRGSNAQIALATAMAAVDPERALELSWQIETSNRNGNAARTDLTPQFEAQRQIARFLLAPSTSLSELSEALSMFG